MSSFAVKELVQFLTYHERVRKNEMTGRWPERYAYVSSSCKGNNLKEAVSPYGQAKVPRLWLGNITEDDSQTPLSKGEQRAIEKRQALLEAEARKAKNRQSFLPPKIPLDQLDRLHARSTSRLYRQEIVQEYTLASARQASRPSSAHIGRRTASASITNTYRDELASRTPRQSARPQTARARLPSQSLQGQAAPVILDDPTESNRDTGRPTSAENQQAPLSKPGRRMSPSTELKLRIQSAREKKDDDDEMDNPGNEQPGQIFSLTSVSIPSREPKRPAATSGLMVKSSGQSQIK